MPSSSWIQHPITHELIPREYYVRPKELRHFIHGDIEAFVSPIDRTVISDRRQLEEHNRRHGVVNAAEFSPEFMAKKQQEREDRLNGVRSKGEVLRDKQQMYEHWTRLENNRT